jgi:hypothetical protein
MTKLLAACDAAILKATLHPGEVGPEARDNRIRRGPRGDSVCLSPYSGSFYIAGEADRLQGVNQVPSDVGLPPA